MGKAVGFRNTAVHAYQDTSEMIIGETVTYLNCSLKRHDLAVAFLEQLDTRLYASWMPI